MNMTRAWIAAAALLTALAGAQLPGREPDRPAKDGNPDFASPKPLGPHLPLDQALTHLRADTIDFDVAALRDDYAAQPGFKAVPWFDRTKAAEALKADRPADARKLADACLTDHPLEISAWIARSQADRALGDIAAAGHDLHIAVTILRGVESTGDGMAAATAWHVISVEEKYAMLSVKGLRSDGQALIQQDGHSYDQLKVTDVNTGAQSARWFNIDRVFGHEF